MRFRYLCLWVALIAALVLPAAPNATGQVVEQQPGIEAELDQLVTVGEQNPLQIQILDLSYHITPYANFNTSDWLLRSEKVLLIHFTAQNATNRDIRFRAAILKFTAIDEKGLTHDWQQVMKASSGTDAGTRITDEDLFAPRLDMTLKPGQKVTCKTSIRVPADLKVDKLILEHGGEVGAKAVRYSKLDIGNIQHPNHRGDTYIASEFLYGVGIGPEWSEDTRWDPLSTYSLKLNGIRKVGAEDVGRKPDPSKVYYAASVTLRNISLQEQYLSSTMMAANSYLVFQDGERYERYAGSFQAHAKLADRYNQPRIAPKETTSLRVVFAVNSKQPGTPEYIEICQGGRAGGTSRAYRYTYIFHVH